MTDSNIPDSGEEGNLDNKLPTTPTNKVTIKPSKCRNKLCPNCIRGKVNERRFQLYDATKNWQGAVMVVLTVDPETISTSEKAWSDLKVRAISSFAKKISDSYFYWLEFHENGRPHWNVVVDSNKPKQVRKMARKHWKQGIAKVGKDEQGEEYESWNKKRCINYAVKVPKHPFPDWFLTTTLQTRLFGSSTGLIQTGGVKKPRPHVSRKGKQEGRAIDRMKKCGQKRDVCVVVSGRKTHVCKLSKEHGKAFGKLKDFRQQYVFLSEQGGATTAERFKKLVFGSF